MIKDTKWTFLNFLPYECGAVEEYLEKMAEKGWLLQRFKGSIAKFKRIEPKKIKYSVDVLSKVSYFDHENSEVALEYREYCQAAGWNYVCQKGKVQIFYTEDSDKIVSIHTDESEKMKSIFKASFPNVLMQVLITILFILNLYLQLFTSNVSFALATNIGIMATIAMFSVTVINCIEIISFLIWVIRSLGRLKLNEFVPYNSYKQLKTKYGLKIGYAIIMSVALLLSMSIDNNADNKTSISLLLVILIPALVIILVRKFINKARFSKKINVAVTFASTMVSVVLIMNIFGGVLIRQVTELDDRKLPEKKIALTLADFGYSASKDEVLYSFKNRSILAQKEDSSVVNGNDNLSYTILESSHSWAVRWAKSRLFDTYDKYDEDLILLDTKLYGDIKVYVDSRKRTFIFVSDNKIVDVKKDMKGLSDEELIDKVCSKLF